ncbi:MAG TPA: T9SS type A sorting domain-containing protein, partial [Adhaeribacter sp.]|nr:T9SS type A sorting domain-containing protein [Adhaeribacter sp.]
HNNLNFSTYQSELFMFDVTYSEYTRLSNLIYDQTDPAYNPGLLPEICAELSSKHPEPGKTLHPVFCSYIDFECEPADCPVIEDSPCRYEDCCVVYEFLGGGGGGAITDTRLTFDLTFKPATCVKFNDVTKIVFTFPNVASIPYAINVVPVAGYTYSVVNNTVNYTPQGVFLTDEFAFDVPNTFILDPNAQTVNVTFEAGAESFTHSFDIVVITDQNNPPQTDCGLIVVLPVELVSFTGKALNEGIALNWKTASEKHNDRFEVERSYDGRNFETIGIVKGNGTSNVAHNYSFLDKHAKAGINYYRLNQVDFSGDNERTHIIKVVTDRSATALGVQLIPNPCLDQNCTVQLRNIDTTAPLTVELRDLTGRLIFSQQVPADQTSFQLPKVDSGNGIYILSARNGSHTAYQKIIIQ